jgi:hypothetical protein
VPGGLGLKVWWFTTSTPQFCGWEAMGLCFALMHPWKPWIVLACFAAFAGQAAVVYKWKDADGVIHYSDQAVPGAEKIYTATSTTAGNAAAARPSQNTPPTDTPKSASGLNFAKFSITSPAADQTFFGDEVVGVHLTLEPDLKPEQTITWHLNGKQLEEAPTSTQFGLPRLDRGTYILAATITDQSTGESRTSDSVTFFVRQPTALGPQVTHH